MIPAVERVAGKVIAQCVFLLALYLQCLGYVQQQQAKQAYAIAAVEGHDKGVHQQAVCIFNCVRAVHGCSGESVLVKQALPYVRAVGESFPLSRVSGFRVYAGQELCLMLWQGQGFRLGPGLEIYTCQGSGGVTSLITGLGEWVWGFG